MIKKITIFSNIVLLIFFFLDMTGFKIGSFNLVDAAWKDDGIFFLIYAALVILFYVKSKYGKYPLTVFLFMWFIVQFSSHWYYTIWGSSERKLASYNNYFANTYHIVPASDIRIIPDIYHVLLHIFILTAFICITIFCIDSRRKKV